MKCFQVYKPLGGSSTLTNRDIDVLISEVKEYSSLDWMAVLDSTGETGHTLLKLVKVLTPEEKEKIRFYASAKHRLSRKQLVEKAQIYLEAMKKLNTQGGVDLKLQVDVTAIRTKEFLANYEEADSPSSPATTKTPAAGTP